MTISWVDCISVLGVAALLFFVLWWMVDVNGELTAMRKTLQAIHELQKKDVIEGMTDEALTRLARMGENPNQEGKP